MPTAPRTHLSRMRPLQPQARSRPDTRPSAHARGYGRAWGRLRAWVLARRPLCAVCGGPATDVDHIIPRERGGLDSPTNLQGLCHSHHSQKTAREDGGFGHARKGPARKGAA